MFQRNKMNNNVSDRSTTKPVYLITTYNPTVKGKFAYYISRSIGEHSNCLEVKGIFVNKNQVEQFYKDPFTNNPENSKEIDVRIPWNRVISIENISYKKGKNQNDN